MFATVNRDEDSEPLEHPEPVPRPGQSAHPMSGGEGERGDGKDHRMPTKAELAAFFL